MDTNNGAIIDYQEYGNGVRFDSVDVQLSTNPARMYWVDTLGGNIYAKDMDVTRRRKRAAEDVLVSAVLQMMWQISITRNGLVYTLAHYRAYVTWQDF